MDHNQETRASRSRNRRRRRGHGGAFRVGMTIVLILVITLAMLLCMVGVYIRTQILPNVDLQLASVETNLTTSILYRDTNTGNYVEMQSLYGSENRVWVERSGIPDNLMNAAVAIEDKRFYKHQGVDWVRTLKGITCMFTGAKIQGGSTITQQLIKNITGDDDVTVKRKITEIFRALEFEKNYSKEEILVWYLNYIYLGEGCNGVYTAAYTYFGKNVADLTLAECASLIGITNNPSKYDPYSPLKVTDEETGEVTTAKDFNKMRQEMILDAMAEQGYITQEECDAAKAETLVFQRGEDELAEKTVYSWYVDAVIDDVIDDLVEVYDMSEERAKDLVFSGGLQIYTCMNPEVQAAVDEVYTDQSNLPYTSSTGQQLQSAITIIDNETGNCVAMAGGIGEKTGNRTWNRATDSLRPPGSSIKPLAVYAPAIELGYITPNSTEVDSPYKDGWPVNSDGKYRGTISIANAVKNSINTIAVKVLANYVTPEVAYEFMTEKYHIDLVESRTKGDKTYSDIALAPLALGGLTDGVSTFDMAAAYSIFPRMGTYLQPRTYTVVMDSNDKILLSNDTSPETALSSRTCYYMTEMLQGVVSGGTGTKANFSGQDIAGKTGTTTSRKDLWFVGYTPYYTAAVWTGYDQQERLGSGLGNPSTTLWNKVMQKVHNGLPYKEFTSPDDEMISVSYCSVSGKLPTSACSGHVVTGKFFPEDAPTGYCSTCKNRSHSSSSSSGTSQKSDQQTESAGTSGTDTQVTETPVETPVETPTETAGGDPPTE